MPSEQPRIGQPVTIEHTDSDGDRTILEGVVEASRADSFSVSLARGEVDLEEGADVRVRYCDASGLCFFLARVLEAHVGERQVVWLESPAQAQRVQRRRFLRLGVQVPISCEREKGDAAPCQATTLELGGNGAGLVSDRPFTVGERVRFSLDLGEKWGVCTGVGQVKRSVLALTPGGGEHRIALQFVEIDSKSQARILSFLLTARRDAEDEA
jgi:c-di-GMP-binding flagellar brake protein YcgR